MEATKPPERINVKFEIRDGQPCFIIHNPGLIPNEIALQIFKRSFSTKSSHSRGLGTYSMRLFGEKYLGGQVSFTTDEQNGTSFFMTLPAEQYSGMNAAG